MDRLIDIPKQLTEIEADLKILEVPLAEFLKANGIQRVTWWRWKKGSHEPLASVWHMIVVEGKALRKRVRSRRPRAA